MAVCWQERLGRAKRARGSCQVLRYAQVWPAKLRSKLDSVPPTPVKDSASVPAVKILDGFENLIDDIECILSTLENLRDSLRHAE
jgi:hypothetical protein